MLGSFAGADGVSRDFNSAGTLFPGLTGGGVIGFGGTGGTGGTGGGGGGRTYTDARITDLLGGSGGGSGAITAGFVQTHSGGGGGGGGALLLLAQNTLSFGSQGTVLAKGGAGGGGEPYPVGDLAAGGGGGAGGSVVLCAPGIALTSGSRIHLGGGTFGTGSGASNGTAGETGRLAIYSKTSPVTAGANITATRFDNTLTAYPLALTVAGDAPPTVVSVAMSLPNVAGNRTVSIRCTGTPGARYTLERSPDLATWTPEGIARTAAADGLMFYNSTGNPGTTPKLYWRCRKL